MCHPSCSSSVCITSMETARRTVAHLPPSPKWQRGMGVRYLATVWTWSLKFLTFLPSRTGRSDPLCGRVCDCFDQAEVMLGDVPSEDTQGHAASAWLSWKGPSPDVSSWNPVAVPGETQSTERPVQGISGGSQLGPGRQLAQPRGVPHTWDMDSQPWLVKPPIPCSTEEPAPAHPL